MIPRIETERLILRGYELSDFPAYAEFWESKRAETMGGPFDHDAAWEGFAAEAGQWILRGYGMWIIVLKSTNAPVGYVGFFEPIRYDQVELSWALFAGYEGNGFAYEAALAARDYGAKSLGITRPASFITATNMRSIALAKRLGATCEDTQEDYDGPNHIFRHIAPEVAR